MNLGVQNGKFMAKYFSFIKFGNPLYILALNDIKFGLTSRTARILIFFSPDFKNRFVVDQVHANSTDSTRFP